MVFRIVAKLRKEIYDMILWWMEQGVGGFRLDVIDQIAKEPDQGCPFPFSPLKTKDARQKNDLIPSPL